MKNKTIYIGPSGSGKSYKALSKTVKNKGTTVIVNYAAQKSTYEKAFPELQTFEEKDGRYNFAVKQGGKYYSHNLLSHKHAKHTAEFAKALITGCDYGNLKEDENAMVLFDDGSWDRIPDKLLTLWQLSHVNCGISITVDSINDLLDLRDSDFNKQMIEDIEKGWYIVYCSRADWDENF